MKYIVSLSLFCFFACTWALPGDFGQAVSAYEQGQYTTAEVYLRNFLEEQPHDTHVPDAEYYLIKIYDRKNDLPNFVSSVHHFLEHHTFDSRCPEIFNMLIKRLSEHEALSLVLEYIKEYDYLITDHSILGNIGYGLLKQKRAMLADYVLSLCPQTDTIKLLRAQLLTEPEQKKKIYESIPGPRGSIYYIEYLLEIGDTLTAFEIYKTIDEQEVFSDILYRYAKISRFFDPSKFKTATQQLRMMPAFRNKAVLLEALQCGSISELVTPEDEEECVLFVNYLKQDTVVRALPDTVDLRETASELLDENKIRELRAAINDNFYLDSIYCKFLLAQNRVAEAFAIIEPYLKFCNVIHYARTIRALKYYEERNYKRAATDIILSHNRAPEMKLIMANCLTYLEKDATDLYEEIMIPSEDSSLVFRARKALISTKFEHGYYLDVSRQDPEHFMGDTSLIKKYMYSLARTGMIKKADSIFNHYYFTQADDELRNYYGEYLIENKYYNEAESYYDSIVQEYAHPPEKIYYNWAFVALLKGDGDTALLRFRSYVKNFKNEQNYHNALFKIATIHYSKQEFDSAGYYYGLASKDNRLQRDALRNQIICYKKSQSWQKEISAAWDILPLIPIDEESEIRFELGYAYLRDGKVGEAIKHLKTAVESASTPEHHYWLAEAYLSKGDFIRALYQYQKIANLFPHDEMWAPTAQYKSGIVLEFMDQFNEAKKIYKQLINDRGLGDTWGAEAQKRLEKME